MKFNYFLLIFIMPTKEQAIALADKYLTDTRRHCDQVAQIMAYFAKKL
jgi:hypothetical protein